MAQTWQDALTSSLPVNYDAHAVEGANPPLSYQVQRFDNKFVYSTVAFNRANLHLPVEVMMGGKRHGLGFLVRIDQLSGIPLARPALIQARYFWSFTRNTLVLAPGVPADTPRSYQTALGLVLSPGFEKRCLTCHGQPNTLGAGKAGGVHCESCHGPGSAHIEAVSKGAPHTGVINPKTLNAEASIAICGQCHAGFGRHIDPAPEDLLIANQVNALKSSECFIQSGDGFTCTTCHNPHQDSASDAGAVRKVCLGCHASLNKQHAGICPVSAAGNCIACHMPSVEIGPLHLIDHWIRVHREQGVKATTKDENLRSRVRPLREYLRIITANDAQTAELASKRLAKGESFYGVARDLSTDSTAPIGGYLGGKWLSQMDPIIADGAAALDYGEVSGVIHSSGHWVIVQRMPRQFKWQAEQVQREASNLLVQGDRKAALEKAQQALMLYPYFLRALTFMGTTLAEAGATQRASEILGLATRIYPDDAGALFDLGLTLDRLGRKSEAIEAYRNAIQLEPDFVAAYAKLGTAMCASEQWQSAIDVFRQGLQIDPLAAELYYDLSLALARTGDTLGAKRAMTLAGKIDPALLR